MRFTIDVDPEDVFDGWHSVGELYDHRHMLYALLVMNNWESAWMSNRLSSGNLVEKGWFILGLELSTGQISYHMPIEMWKGFEKMGVVIHEVAPWDGHDSEEVLFRMKLQWFHMTSTQKVQDALESLIEAGLPVEHLIGTVHRPDDPEHWKR